MFVLYDNNDKEFYTGKVLQHQDIKYATVSSILDDAKTYKNKKVAQNSCDKVNEKVYSRDFVVRDLDDFKSYKR